MAQGSAAYAFIGQFHDRAAAPVARRHNSVAINIAGQKCESAWRRQVLQNGCGLDCANQLSWQFVHLKKEREHICVVTLVVFSGIYKCKDMLCVGKIRRGAPCRMQ